MAADQLVNILLVDDDSRNLEALEAILSGSGYWLIRASSGEDALRTLLRNDVAAIVLDIRMPDMNGVELARMIKSNSRFRDVPILFLTAYLLDDQDVAAGYGAGAVDYLMKPVNPAILRQKIAVFADLYRKTRALAAMNETLEERVHARTRELEESEAALREADRQKDSFLATLAHELRNPLAPLRMGLELLNRSETAEQRGTLTVMKRQLDHMVRLIDDLLDVARISGGNLELKREQLRVADLVETAVDTCRPFLEQRRQTLQLELDEAIVAFVDPTRVAQIVGNLLHNASKFSPEESHIELRLTYEHPTAKVSVSDRGIGLAPGELPRVFEMFARIDRGSGGNTGLGIGLALSRRLAHMHEGEIAVASPGPGQGSVFTLSLPAELAEAGWPSSRTSISSRPPQRRIGEPVSVLIIEDNEDSAEVLALALEGQGYVPSVAHDGAEGLAQVSAKRPQIVLCDIGLPEMEGTEVCRRIRQTNLGYQPILIALTGWGSQEDVHRTKESGFDHHLVKPVEPEALFRLLESLTSSSPAA